MSRCPAIKSGLNSFRCRPLIRNLSFHLNSMCLSSGRNCSIRGSLFAVFWLTSCSLSHLSKARVNSNQISLIVLRICEPIARNTAINEWMNARMKYEFSVLIATTNHLYNGFVFMTKLLYRYLKTSAQHLLAIKDRHRRHHILDTDRQHWTHRTHRTRWTHWTHRCQLFINWTFTLQIILLTDYRIDSHVLHPDIHYGWTNTWTNA